MNLYTKTMHARVISRTSQRMAETMTTLEYLYKISEVVSAEVGPIAAEMAHTKPADMDGVKIAHAADVMIKSYRAQQEILHLALGTSRFGGLFYTAIGVIIGVIIGSVMMGIHLS